MPGLHRYPSMHLEYVWRAVSVGIGIVYACAAFSYALHGERLWVLVDCMVAAIWFHGAAHAHFRVKRSRQKNNEP